MSLGSKNPFKEFTYTPLNIFKFHEFIYLFFLILYKKVQCKVWIVRTYMPLTTPLYDIDALV